MRCGPHTAYKPHAHVCAKSQCPVRRESARCRCSSQSAASRYMRSITAGLELYKPPSATTERRHTWPTEHCSCAVGPWRPRNGPNKEAHAHATCPMDSVHALRARRCTVGQLCKMIRTCKEEYLGTSASLHSTGMRCSHCAQEQAANRTAGRGSLRMMLMNEIEIRTAQVCVPSRAPGWPNPRPPLAYLVPVSGPSLYTSCMHHACRPIGRLLKYGKRHGCPCATAPFCTCMGFA